MFLIIFLGSANKQEKPSETVNIYEIYEYWLTLNNLGDERINTGVELCPKKEYNAKKGKSFVKHFHFVK